MGRLGAGASPSDAAIAMAELALGGAPAGEKQGGGPPVVVVYHRGGDGKCWMDLEDGRLEVDPAALEEKARKGARVFVVDDVRGAGDCPAIRFGERGSVPKEERDPPVSPEVRERVFARDGYRCVICGSRHGITPHHLDSHGHGGKGAMRRLCTLCARCHGACHAGDLLLRVEEDGRVTARDRYGKVVTAVWRPAEILGDAADPEARGMVEPPEEGRKAG